MRLVCIFAACLATLGATAEVIPPKPAQYFNDYAHVVSPATAAELNQKLEQFERDTSSQIVVAVYPKMESDSSIEDYTVRVSQSWEVGQKEKSNGAVLFVFVQDRKMYIQVGTGWKGRCPTRWRNESLRTRSNRGSATAISMAVFGRASRRFWRRREANTKARGAPWRIDCRRTDRPHQTGLLGCSLRL